MLAEYDITGKVALVTGAGRGIGKGIAQVLAEAGADVAINALTPKYVEGLAADIAAATHRKVVPVVGDVTTADGAQRAIDHVLKTFGHLDILVNALGDSIRTPLVTLPDKEGGGTQISDRDLRFIMDINLSEALYCTRAAGPHMLQRRSGKVINIASWIFGVGAARVTSPDHFRPALEKALADGGPYVIAIDVPTDSEVSPWAFIHPAKNI